MHDIWNPWHGCTKISEGCANCYMYTMDKSRGLDGSVVRRNKSMFDYPLQRRRDGSFKVRPGELIRICMTSDFLVEEADPWRDEVWDIIHQRPDVRFFILTKRPERFAACLPRDWGDGWSNVMLNVTCENQCRADERIPILLATPAKHKGIMCAPFIGSVSIERYLRAGDKLLTSQIGAGQPTAPGVGIPQASAPSGACSAGAIVRGCGIEQVVCGGENYEGARPCDFGWVRTLHDECVAHDVTFAFIETGSVLVKDGRAYRLRSKSLQSQQAFKSGMHFIGRPIEWHLTDNLGLPLPRSAWMVPRFRRSCATCGSLAICNGCTNCGQCGRAAEKLYALEELFDDRAPADSHVPPVPKRRSVVWDVGATSSDEV